MALIDVAARRIHAKLVYYGPDLCGKTTNLRAIHARLPEAPPDDLHLTATENETVMEAEPALRVEFLPLDLDTADGFTIKLHLYAAPAQDCYERTRVALLNGADGAVFVADARRDRLGANVQSLRELALYIARQNRRFVDYPLVMQYNKMDLPDALPTPVLDRHLNTIRFPRFGAEAINGVGVVETLRAISNLVTTKLW